MWFLGASCKLLSLSSIMALKFLAVSSRAFLDLICISSSPLRQWPGKVSRFLLFSPFFVSSFLNFSCFVEGPPWPHLHFFVSFRQRPCKISKFSLFSQFSLFRGGPSLTSFAFPRHFSSMALQNFEVFVILLIFVVFIVIAVSSRAFLDLICISSSLFLSGPAKFWDFCYFPIFVALLQNFVIFVTSSQSSIRDITIMEFNWCLLWWVFFNDRYTL